MKKICLEVLLFYIIPALYAISPGPVPFQPVSLSNFNGSWYIVWEFNSYFNNSNTPNINKCMMLGIDINSPFSGEVEVNTRLPSKKTQTTKLPFNANNPENTIWEINGNNYTWIWVNTPQWQWAVLGAMEIQEAIIISRNKSLSTLIIEGEALTLFSQRYTVNQTNYYIYNNSEC